MKSSSTRLVGSFRIPVGFRVVICVLDLNEEEFRFFLFLLHSLINECVAEQRDRSTAFRLRLNESLLSLIAFK